MSCCCAAGTCTGMFWRDDPRGIEAQQASKPDWPKNGAVLRGQVYLCSSKQRIAFTHYTPISHQHSKYTYKFTSTHAYTIPCWRFVWTGPCIGYASTGQQELAASRRILPSRRRQIYFDARVLVSPLFIRIRSIGTCLVLNLTWPPYVGTPLLLLWWMAACGASWFIVIILSSWITKTYSQVNNMQDAIWTGWPFVART